MGNLHPRHSESHFEGKRQINVSGFNEVLGQFHDVFEDQSLLPLNDASVNLLSTPRQLPRFRIMFR
jgi:hypothetical protein